MYVITSGEITNSAFYPLVYVKQHKEFCAKFDAIVVTMEQDFLDEIILGADATMKRLSPRTRSIRT